MMHRGWVDGGARLDVGTRFLGGAGVRGYENRTGGRTILVPTCHRAFVPTKLLTFVPTPPLTFVPTCHRAFVPTTFPTPKGIDIPRETFGEIRHRLAVNLDHLQRTGLLNQVLGHDAHARAYLQDGQAGTGINSVGYATGYVQVNQEVLT